MPLISRIPFPGGWVALWHIAEGCGELAALCSPEDAARGEAFSKEARRRGWYAWRALLREVEGDVEVGYAPSGAPFIVGRPDQHISVSHAGDYAAVMVSERRCGVDIERLDRNFERVAARYLSPEEEALLPEVSPWTLAVAWSAKEAAYKWYGEQEVDLLKDIRLLSLEQAGAAGSEGNQLFPWSDSLLSGRLTVCVRGTTAAMSYNAGDGMAAVWTE